MKDIVRKKLVYLIDRYGDGLSTEPECLRNYLRDLCGEHKKEINVLFLAAKERLPEDLSSMSKQIPLELLLKRLAIQLSNNTGIEKSLAYWAVESWAEALDLVGAKKGKVPAWLSAVSLAGLVLLVLCLVVGKVLLFVEGDVVNKVLFVSERDGNPEIYVMFEDGSNQYNLSNNPSSDYYPRWSPNALQVSIHAYPPGILAGEGDAQLFLIDIEKNTKVRLETTVMSAKFAAWSPDGTEIVFSGAENDDWDLYVLDLESRHTRHLTQGKNDDYFPVWSPSGREIAFVRVLEQEEREIYAVTVDGLEIKNLTNTPGWDGYPSWSPDGQKIIFSSRRTGNEEIYLMSSDGNNLKQITNNPAFDNTEPSFSPGGERVVFVSNRDGNREIYIMNVDGSNIVRLTRNGSQDYNPHWR
ncbi:MAG: oligogalacturonate lyase family protein [Anaerolineales bacterium]